jgi:NAD(P)-dependent dehydrogenase (short-subunit alcohol dehydrogenase family)
VAKATDVALLIKNAGIVTNFGGALSDAGVIEAGLREMEITVFGPFALTQSFAPVLAKNGGSRCPKCACPQEADYSRSSINRLVVGSTSLIERLSQLATVGPFSPFTPDEMSALMRAGW